MVSMVSKRITVVSTIFIVTVVLGVLIQIYSHPQPEVDKVVDAAWLKANLSNKELTIVATGNNKSLYEQGCIPNSLFVGYSDLIYRNASIPGLVLGVEAFESLMSRYGIPNNTTIVFYDYQSGLYAARAYWTFFYYGETNLLLLNGGIRSWLSQNFPLTTPATVKPPTIYKLGSINHQVLATLTDVKNHLNDTNYVIIDCRSKAEYLSGHIPGAVNIEWSLTLTPEGLFKDQRQLKELFTQNGVTPDKNIITYCTTGVRGAHTWFVLHEVLKYPNVRLYDGSWVEWVAAGQPIEK